MRTAFIDTLTDLARRDPNLWLVCGDLGYGVLDKFAAEFPKRFINAGVAEQNMIGLAAGLALSGKTVFVYSIANFPTMRCLEQIRNDVCYHQANVKVVAVGGGYTYGTHGYTHFGLEDIAVLRALPGLTVAAPGDPIEADLVTRAVAQQYGPAYLRLGKAGEPKVHTVAPKDFALGQALRLREGADITLISTGGMLKLAADTAAHLAHEGLDVGVLSMPTIKPIDAAAILAVRHAPIVSVEEHSVTGGLGSAVAEVLAEAGGERGVAFRRFGAADRVSYQVGNQAFLQAAMGDLPALVRALVAESRERTQRAHR
jgi:transketolase